MTARLLSLRPGQAGFTLIETVLAVAMSTALLTALFILQDRARSIRATVMDYTDQAREHRLIMDQMSADLRGAVPFPFFDAGLTTNAEQVQLVTTAVPGPGVWLRADSDPRASDVPPEHDLRIVGYQLRSVENEQGQMEVVGLERTSQRIVLAETAERGKEIQAQLLSRRYKFLRLAYTDGTMGTDGISWQSQWDQQSPPVAVEIVLGVEPLPEGTAAEEYPYETFRRVVFIPAGVRVQEGGGRGGDGGEGTEAGPEPPGPPEGGRP